MVFGFGKKKEVPPPPPPQPPPEQQLFHEGAMINGGMPVENLIAAPMNNATHVLLQPENAHILNHEALQPQHHENIIVNEEKKMEHELENVMHHQNGVEQKQQMMKPVNSMNSPTRGSMCSV
jgi:hypothetical protein